MSEEDRLGEYNGRIWIPVITIARARQIIKHIKPVYRFKNKIRYIKRFRNMFTVDFTLFAEPSNRRVDKLKDLCEIVIFHKKNRVYNFMRPTLLEILSQIPEKYFGKVVAFEFIGELEKDNELKLVAGQLGYWVGKVRLYSSE